MPQRNLVNAVDAALTVAMDTTIVTMSVDDAAKLPPVPFFVVVDPFDDAVREYMECTSIAGNVLTVVRAVEGSTVAVTILPVNPPVTILPTNQPAALPAGSPHAVGAIVRIAIMAQHLDELWAEVSGNYLRLDAGNDPALRHDIVLESAAVFDGASFISTADVNLLDADTAHTVQSIGGWKPNASAGIKLLDNVADVRATLGYALQVTANATGIRLEPSTSTISPVPIDAGDFTAAATIVSPVDTDMSINVNMSVDGWVFCAFVPLLANVPTRISVTLPSSIAQDVWFFFVVGDDGAMTEDDNVMLFDVVLREGTDPSFVPSLRIVGDIDLRARISRPEDVTTPTIIATGNGVGYDLLSTAAGAQIFSRHYDTSGGGTINLPLDAPLGIDSVKTLRATHDTVNGVGNTFVDGVQQQAVTTLLPIGERLPTGNPVVIGGYSPTGENTFTGTILFAEVRDGIDGPIVARYDAAEHLVGGDEYTDPSGRVWTATGSFTFKTTVSPAATLDDIGGGDGDSTYLRLDATNDPAQRHDVVVGGLLSFDGASYLSTPNTPDLAALDDVDITADVQSDWDTTPSATFFMNGDFTVGQSLGFDLSGNRSSVRLNTNAISGLNDSMVGSSRHSIRVTSDGAEIVSYVDGIEVKRLAVVAPSGPVALPLLVGTGWSSGSSFNQFIGNIYSAQIGHFNQPPIATFNADDLIGQISEGPVPDGTTFTSGGRVWTVVGAGVTFAGTASPVATLDDINAFPVQEAPLDSLQYLRQDGAWVPFAAASITDLNTLDTRLDIVDTAFHQLLTALTARVQALEAP